MLKLLAILCCFGLPRSFLPDITTYRRRRNWTSWIYHICRGIKTWCPFKTDLFITDHSKQTTFIPQCIH